MGAMTPTAARVNADGDGGPAARVMAPAPITSATSTAVTTVSSPANVAEVIANAAQMAPPALPINAAETGAANCRESPASSTEASTATADATTTVAAAGRNQTVAMSSAIRAVALRT